MDEYKPQLNCKRAIGLTQTEYYEENKETILVRVKKYRQQNKEKIAEYKKTTKFKQLKSVNDKKYREKNKEKIKEKINCKVCNKLICKYGMKKHIKRKHPTCI